MPYAIATAHPADVKATALVCNHVHTQDAERIPVFETQLNQKSLDQCGRVMSLEITLLNFEMRLNAYRCQAESEAPSMVFFSVCGGSRRAQVVHGMGRNLQDAWTAAVLRLKSLTCGPGFNPRWVEMDWTSRLEKTDWRTLRALLADTKRNYFRLGIALDPAGKVAFLEKELNANAMLYGGNTIEHAVLNEANFKLYAGQRFGASIPLDFSDNTEVFAFETQGLFQDETGAIHEISGQGLDSGHRIISDLDTDHVDRLIISNSHYLGKQVQEDGRFVYGRHSCFDRTIDGYNALRHASTTYSMIEAWELTRDDQLRVAIDRALDYLTGVLIERVTLPDGTQAAFLVDLGGEIKLGANAVAILALAKYSEVTRTGKFGSTLEELGLGLEFMQDPTTGSFIHVLNFPDLSVKEEFRTIYYDGEAAFGLMRLYSLTKELRWLTLVERAFKHFIASEHWRHHDHWLSYCANELTRYRPERQYFQFAVQNFTGHLDFVSNRITTFPTLLELMTAAREMIVRITKTPGMQGVLVGTNLADFRRALERRAHRLLDGHFWPETAMYFRRPDKIAGSCFIRHHAFRVRIDDVEHYLSGFIAYRRYLVEWNEFDELVRSQTDTHHIPAKQPEEDLSLAGAIDTSKWTTALLANVTGGTWLQTPLSRWSAKGICTFAPAMRDGDLVLARTKGGRGIPERTIAQMQPQPLGIITEQPGVASYPGIPLLSVESGDDAILAMGSYARGQIAGTVLAVTGSAGKTTTTAMLAHVLTAVGSVAKTAGNANLRHGVAWNLASIDWQASHVVLEMAVGKMAQTARLARPDVAVFTNILPAHLGRRKHAIKDIALAKSDIFLGMQPGGIAVLNRDMQEWSIVNASAKAHGLRIVQYGTEDTCDAQLLFYDAGMQTVTARLFGDVLTYRLGAAGLHMAMNSLAVLAAAAALGHDVSPMLAKLENFSALPGRGDTFEITFDSRRLTVMDDAYNANPGSMTAALDRLGTTAADGRRIAVLGSMAELGPQTRSFHRQLAAVIKPHPIDRIYVLGENYSEFWRELPEARRGGYASSLDQLKALLADELEDGDVVLFKGSNSANIHQLVDWIKRASQPAQNHA